MAYRVDPGPGCRTFAFVGAAAGAVLLSSVAVRGSNIATIGLSLNTVRAQDAARWSFGPFDCAAGQQLLPPQIAPVSVTLSEKDLVALLNRSTPVAPIADAYGLTLPHPEKRAASADALKVIETGNVATPYLGVYHHNDGADRFRTSFVGTRDFVRWQPLGDLGHAASMPDIRMLIDGSILYADERNPSGRRPQITVRHYAGLAEFIAAPAHPSAVLALPRTRGATADGTPNFGRIAYNGDIRRSRIEVSHHYYAGGIHDQNASGTLVGFQTWRNPATSKLNQAFAELGYAQVGGREWFSVGGVSYALVEARPHQTAGWDKWRIFLVNACTGRITPLAPKLIGGAASVGNPRLSFITLPDGRPGFAFSVYLFAEGAKATPPGSHFYVAPLPVAVSRPS